MKIDWKNIRIKELAALVSGGKPMRNGSPSIKKGLHHLQTLDFLGGGERI